MEYSKGLTKLERAKNLLVSGIRNPLNALDSIRFYSRLRLRALNNPTFAEKVEKMFLPSNVMIMAILALASYMFIFAPGAHPSSVTIIAFLVSAAIGFGIMEVIKRKVTNPDTYNMTSLRLTILTLIIPLMLMQVVGLPQVFVFGATTLLILSPLMFVIRSKWKISGHMCTSTAMITIMSLFNGWFAALYVLIPVISWSRLKLNAHTTAQVVAGVLIGFLTPFTFSMLIPLA